MKILLVWVAGLAFCLLVIYGIIVGLEYVAIHFFLGILETTSQRSTK